MPRSHWQTGAHSPRASPAATLGRMLSPCASTAPLIRHRLERGEPQAGALALAFGAQEGGVCVRLGVVHSVGPAWYSRAGGRIDRRITLDIGVSPTEEGGPVLDAGGGLLGMSTL